MKSMTISLQNQKRALQLKYLLQRASTQNQTQLVQILNRIYPFTENPLTNPPPLELLQTHKQQVVSQNIHQALANNSYIIITGGLLISRGQHQFVENRLMCKQTLDQVLFNVKEPGVILKALPNTCYIKIHNIWIELARKKQFNATQDFIKLKLLEVPFFANLTFQQFNKCCKVAKLTMLGPGDLLLKSGETPYSMFIVVEGELVFEKKVKLVKDKQLWVDVLNQLQREEDDTCQLMFEHLVKNPKQKDDYFEVIFKIKNVNEHEIICARQTLDQLPINYDIVSSLKTKLISIRYPDFYNLSSDRLNDIRAWPKFQRNDVELRRDYYYQVKWQQFKQQVKRQSKLNKLENKKFQDFLRKAVNLSQQKHYYCPHKVGEGTIIDSPAGMVSKLKFMSYREPK